MMRLSQQQFLAAAFALAFWSGACGQSEVEADVGMDADLNGPGADASFADAGPSDGESDASTSPEANVDVQLLGDHRFLEGFKTYPAVPTTTSTGELIPLTSGGSPVWNLAEWHSQGLLANVPPTQVATGSQWSNGFKRVIVADGFLELAVNSDAEYNGVYRQQEDQWPHLLVSQKIFNASDPASNTPVHLYKSVVLSLSLELVHAQHIYESGYNSSIHACQFLMFFTLQNRNPEHEDYGNFIWFGLPFYDDRYETVGENIAIEHGLGKYMFRMASSDFMPESLHNVSSVNISVDLAPAMKEKLQDAIDQGILKSSDLDDYFIGGMNMGFEVPGRSIATMRVRDLSVVAE